jgi:hypothetical protein
MSISDDIWTYVGIWPDQGTALIDIKAGKDEPNKTRLANMRMNGLVMRDSLDLTQEGHNLAERVQRICSGEVPAEDSAFLMAKDMDLRKAVRHETAKTLGLKSIHLKLLRSLVVHPGQAYYSLKLTYGGPAIEFVQEHKLVTAGESRYIQLYPTKTGQAVMLGLIAAQLSFGLHGNAHG